jgi:hypothetical protein
MYMVFARNKVPRHSIIGDVLGLDHLASFTPLPGNRLMRLPGMLRGGVTTIYADKHPFAGGKDHYSLYFEDPDRMKVELVAP